MEETQLIFMQYEDGIQRFVDNELWGRLSGKVDRDIIAELEKSILDGIGTLLNELKENL